MYHIAVSFTVPADRRDDFVVAALEDGRNSLGDEPGCARFELIADAEDPNRFYLNEAYVNEAAFDAHCDGPHFARFFELIKQYADGPTWLIKGTAITDYATTAS
jgi:autoinducer 2-degrading protein